MAENIRCVECGTTVFGFVLEGQEPRPVKGDECPNCGGTEFNPLDEVEEAPDTED